MHTQQIPHTNINNFLYYLYYHTKSVVVYTIVSHYSGSRGWLFSKLVMMSRESSNSHISLPKTFASGDVAEWFNKYEICCKANKWSDETKATKLPTLLEGEALAVWLELSEEQQSDYKQAKEKITDKLAPLKFEALDKFHKCRLQYDQRKPYLCLYTT